jgi:hypothetical protein
MSEAGDLTGQSVTRVSGTIAGLIAAVASTIGIQEIGDGGAKERCEYDASHHVPPIWN